MSAAAGRDVSIDGDVDFTILPRPAFNAAEVRLSGVIADDYVAVERLSARLVFGPLLLGRLQFRELVLRRPDVRITRTAAGFDFPLSMGARDAPSESSQSPAASAPAIERVRIDGGAFTFQDTVNGTALKGEGVDLTIIARARGAISVEGSLVIEGIPLAMELMLTRAAGLNGIAAAVLLTEAEATAKFTGTLSPANELRGDINIAGSSSGAVLAAFGLGGMGAGPQALQKPFTFTGKVNGNLDSARIEQIVWDIGGTSAKGGFAWKAGSPPHLDVKLEFAPVQLAAWRTAALAPPGAGYAFGIASARAQEPQRLPDSLFAPFKNLSADIDVRIPVMSYRGEVLRDGNFTASLAGGEFKVSDMSVGLPGITRVKAFGAVRAEGFDGAVEMSTGDARAVLTWLGGDVSAVPKGRLGNASLRAAIQGSPARFTLGDIAGIVDTSRVAGRMSFAGGARPFYGLELVIDSLNLDAYLPRGEAFAPPQAQSAQPNAAGYGVAPKFVAFRGLADVDAEASIQVSALTAGGVANGKAGFDAGLKDGKLTVRSAAFDGGGASAWISGAVSGFGLNPRFEDVQFDLSSDDLGRLGRLLGFDMPPYARALAPISLTGVIGGGLAEADVALSIKAAGAMVQINGQASGLDQARRLVLDVNAGHGSYAALMRAMDLYWPQRGADPGPAQLTAHIVHEKSETKIENLKFGAGAAGFGGALTITDQHGVPNVTGEITAINLDIDKLVPKDPAQRFAASTAVKTIANLRPGTWSSEPFDWSVLQGWRGDVKLSGTLLNMRGVLVQDFAARVTVNEGAAEVSEWSGKLFGAPAQVSLKAAATPESNLQGQIAFTGGELASVTAALGGSQNVKAGVGKVDFTGGFQARGLSPAAFVASLSGAGMAKITATEAGSGAVAGLLSAITAANRAEGMGSKPGPVAVSARLSAAAGQIKIEDAAVVSRSYDGAFAGSVDLPHWQIDLAGRLRMERRGAGDQRPSVIPITIKGALDLPTILLLPSP